MGLSAWLTRCFSQPDSRWYIVDHPNERSLHTRPTPRTGGVAIAAAIAVGVLFALFWLEADMGRLAWLGAGGLLVAGISFLDDRLDLSPALRFVVQVLVAALLVNTGFSITHVDLPGVSFVLEGTVGVAVSGLFIVWMMNLYNFMDGMDGFAGGMSVIGFATLGWLGAAAGHDLFALLSLVVAAAALGFLFFNFPPARIFMGDVGSSVLGLLAAAMSLWGISERVFPFWTPVLVFSPFIFDATATLIRRLYKGERVWRAHKTHYYQRLVQLGWGHRRTVLREYGLMIGCALSAIWAISSSVLIQWLVIGGWVVAYGLLARFVISREAQHASFPSGT